MIVALAWATLLSAPAPAARPVSPAPAARRVAAPQDTLLHVVRARLVGPLREAHLDQGGRGGTTVSAALVAGERRTELLPLVSRPLDDAWPTPTIAAPREGAEGAEGRKGAVELLEWVDPVARLPRELARRPRPPVGSTAERAGLPALALLAAGALGVLAARRRARLVPFVGAAAAAAVAVFALSRPSVSASAVRVLEGVAREGGDAWMQVDGSAGALSMPPWPAEVSAAPRDAALEWHASLDAQGAEWTAAVQDGQIWRRAPLDPYPRRWARAANTWGALDATWTRGTDGAWTARGRWGLGEELPSASGSGSPPGWLSAGLPQGVGVLVGRLDPGAWNGAPLGQGPVAPRSSDVSWVRLVGFDSLESH